jgi:hypothetical protein
MCFQRQGRFRQCESASFDRLVIQPVKGSVSERAACYDLSHDEQRHRIRLLTGEREVVQFVRNIDNTTTVEDYLLDLAQLTVKSLHDNLPIGPFERIGVVKQEHRQR